MATSSALRYLHNCRVEGRRKGLRAVDLPRVAIRVFDVPREKRRIHQRGALEPRPQFPAQRRETREIVAERNGDVDEFAVGFSGELE